MIQRIVLVKLNDKHATASGRAEVIRYSRSTLSGLRGVKALEVGAPADDRSAQSWDLSILVHFSSNEEVEAYLRDPTHRSYVDDYLRPRMEVIKAWNFTV